MAWGSAAGQQNNHNNEMFVAKGHPDGIIDIALDRKYPKGNIAFNLAITPNKQKGLLNSCSKEHELSILNLIKPLSHLNFSHSFVLLVLNSV